MNRAKLRTAASCAAVLFAIVFVAHEVTSIARAASPAAPAHLAKTAAPAHPGSDTALVVYTDKVQKTDAEWRKILTPEQYHILREAGTEIAGTGPYLDNHVKGLYRCAACGQLLFSSDTKFESGTGWPSFWKPFSPQSIVTHKDWTLGTPRIEVLCSRCGGHLGHVFDDGPKPTGLRYCMNGAALRFVATK